MTIKFILMFCSFIIISIIVFSFDKFSQYWFVYFCTFGMVIGQALFPIWFFQGIEEMKYITYLNILAKSIFTIAIFIFIKNPSDYYLVPIFISIGFIISGVLSLILIYKKFDIRFKFQNIKTIIFYLKDGWHIFLSSIFTTFYTVSTIFILGLFTNNQIVGYYSLSEKIVKGIGSLFTPINSAIFPYVSNLKINYHNKAITFINKVTIYSAIFMFILSIFIFIYAKEIILLLSNDNFIDSIIILQILSFFPFIITIATIFSTNYFINFDLKHLLSKIYMYSAILSMILSFTLIPIYGAIGSAISVMIIEIFATFYMYLIIKRRILN